MVSQLNSKVSKKNKAQTSLAPARVTATRNTSHIFYRFCHFKVDKDMEENNRLSSLINNNVRTFKETFVN